MCACVRDIKITHNSFDSCQFKVVAKKKVLSKRKRRNVGSCLYLSSCKHFIPFNKNCFFHFITSAVHRHTVNIKSKNMLFTVYITTFSQRCWRPPYFLITRLFQHSEIVNFLPGLLLVHTLLFSVQCTWCTFHVQTYKKPVMFTKFFLI